MKQTLHAAAAALLLLTGGCATMDAAPVNAQAREIPARERQQFQQYHQQIVQQFGGEVQGPLADYVRRVGLRVALEAVPGSRESDWTISVLSSPVPNAMAVPGGYLYITRGLLGMMNSEAELASVLGHEAGHIAARHAQRRQRPATVGALGTIATAVLLGGDAARLAQLGSAALVGGYSRNQEREADSLGLQYMARAGYDPMAAASMLAALDRVATVEGRQQLERPGVASIFASHPVTAERVQRVAEEARRKGVRGVENREPFLAAIDGMTWGDDADQGLVDGPRFRHGTLGFAFAAPPGFQLSNSPAAVTGQGREGAFRFSGVALQPGQSLEAVAADVWRQATGSVPNIRPTQTTVNGLQALVAPAR
ncbi:MAG: M48 family metalloprotease, partial [Thermaurantiacus sp.]